MEWGGFHEGQSSKKDKTRVKGSLWKAHAMVFLGGGGHNFCYLQFLLLPLNPASYAIWICLVGIKDCS